MSSKNVDKIKLNIDNLEGLTEAITTKYGTFAVKTILSGEDQNWIIHQYLYRMFDSSVLNPNSGLVSWTRIISEYALRGDILAKVTNIDVDHLQMHENGDMVVFDDEFFFQIVNKVKNWLSFKELLYTIVNDAIMQRKIDGSIGAVIDKLISTAIENYENITPEKLSEMVEQIKNMGNAIKDSNISGLMDESQNRPAAAEN